MSHQARSPEQGNLARCRVVLVRPKFAGNVGAVARVMRNMGLSNLVLVAPEADPLATEARQRSAQGERILHASRTVAELGEALADCVYVAATSARVGGPYRRQPVGTPDEVMAKLVAALAGGPGALVFGPEDTGLTNAEVMRCHALIHIPADEEYPALNLGQAVAVCLYELRRAWLAGSPLRERPTPAAFADVERALGRLRGGLEAIHFLYGQSADTLMHAVRHLILRAQPTPMEVDVLLGLARQLDWVARRAGERRDA